MSLQATQLAVERDGRALFEPVDFQLQPGQGLWVRGANGSGKTSLLRLLCGLSRPARGQVLWQGRCIRREPQALRQQLLHIGHGLGLKDGLSARENLQLGEGLAGRPVAPDEVDAALAAQGLGGVAARPLGRLSQGQRRRVALARLQLPRAPALWVLDEPWTALDEAAASALDDTLARHLARGGLLVCTTHQARSLPADALQPLDLRPARRPRC